MGILVERGVREGTRHHERTGQRLKRKCWYDWKARLLAMEQQTGHEDAKFRQQQGRIASGKSGVCEDKGDESSAATHKGEEVCGGRTFPTGPVKGKLWILGGEGRGGSRKAKHRKVSVR